MLAPLGCWLFPPNNPYGQKCLTDEELREASSEGTLATDVKVILVSLGEEDRREEVITRNPNWGRLILLNSVTEKDSLIISTSNGGTVKIAASLLQDKAVTGAPFQVDIKNVLLASSLQIIVEEALIPGMQEGPTSAPSNAKEGSLANIKLVSQKITGNTAV